MIIQTDEERNEQPKRWFGAVAIGISHLHVDGALVALVNLQRLDGFEGYSLCQLKRQRQPVVSTIKHATEQEGKGQRLVTHRNGSSCCRRHGCNCL